MHLFKKRKEKTIIMLMLRTGIQCVQWAFSSNDSHFFFALIMGGVQESRLSECVYDLPMEKKREEDLS